jgi:hypothetical protein
MSSAVISNCGKYRYSLKRDISNYTLGKVTFIMLNPSTADASLDDPTIRRCIGYAKDWMMSKLEVVNLYAYRATDPKELWKVEDPVGEDNNLYIQNALYTSDLVVCAWGNNAKLDRVGEVIGIIKEFTTPHYLELSKTGQPKHPLYLKKELQPTRWLV